MELQRLLEYLAEYVQMHPSHISIWRQKNILKRQIKEQCYCNTDYKNNDALLRWERAIHKMTKATKQQSTAANKPNIFQWPYISKISVCDVIMRKHRGNVNQ